MTLYMCLEFRKKSTEHVLTRVRLLLSDFFFLTNFNLIYSDDNKIKFKKIKKDAKRMQHDDLLYLKRSRRFRGLNLFNFLTTKFPFSRFVANSLG